MKAVAVLPGKPNSVHLRDIPAPKLTDQPHPHVCRGPRGARRCWSRCSRSASTPPTARSTRPSTATPRRAATSSSSATRASARSSRSATKVTEVKPGDYVSCTVRRPGGSLFDLIGRNDITSEEVYYERGINLCHGYLTETFVDDAEYMVKVPQNLKHLGVLSEPASVCAKAIEQAYLAQQRLQVWNPKRAFVLGAGQIGLLATMMLRLRGLEVYTLATKPGPHLKSRDRRGLRRDLRQHQADARWHDLAKQVGKPDLIFEATGNAEVCFRAMEVLAHQRRPDLDEHHRRQARRDRRRAPRSTSNGCSATSSWSPASTATAATSSWASRPSRTASSPTRASPSGS